MKYGEVKRFSLSEIENALSGTDVDLMCDSVLSAALYMKDWREAQGICIKALSSEFDEVKRSAIIGLGHIVRIHGKIDIDAVQIELSKKSSDNYLKGYIENLQSDINIFFNDPQNGRSSERKRTPH